MTIETELEALVRIYAKYDEEKKCYSSELNQDDLLKLDADFIRLNNKFLLQSGPDTKKIHTYYKKLSLKFHPDRRDNFSPEVRWLEQNLSEGRNDGICFKTMKTCYEKLTAPQDFKPNNFEEINALEDFKKWLENSKLNSRTFTERNFYASVIRLLNESTGYFDEVGNIKPIGLRALITLFPMIIISLGTFVFAEELFAVYALYFVLLKSGQYIGEGESKELKKLGHTLQKVSVVTATATSTLLVRLFEMTFWASRQFYDVSLQIGAAFFTPLIGSSSATKSKSTAADENTICRDLLLASQNLVESDNFKTPHLKMIAAPIESYLGLLDQQFFKRWRPGGEKSLALQAFLFRMRVIDNSDELTIEEKVEKAEVALEFVKKNSVVYNQNTALAVDRAENVISLLKSDRVLQLTYEL